MLNEDTITLSEQNKAVVKEQLSSGKFKSPNEVIKAGLELLQEEDKKLIALRQAIEEGEASGIAEDFSFEGFLEKKRQQFSNAQK